MALNLHLYSFGVSCVVLRGVCLASNIMGVNGTSPVVLKAANKRIQKTQQRCLCSEIRTWLLTVVHKHICEHFHVELYIYMKLTKQYRLTQLASLKDSQKRRK